MGVTNLLPQLKPIIDRRHVRTYAGKRVGVDVSVWLHRGTYSCSTELFRGIHTTRHVAYCLKMVKLLQEHGVVPLLVFDGGTLDAKKMTAAKRRVSREKMRKAAHAQQRLIKELEDKLAKRLSGLGPSKEVLKEQLTQARKSFEEACQQCVEITPEHCHALQVELRKLNVEFVVAPYEADAQLAFMARHGEIDAVLTEDSDLIAFGCPTILYKLDKNSCEVSELHTDRLEEVYRVAGDFDLRGFTPTMFTQMCVLSGVDYLESLPGIGLITARKLVAQHQSVERIIRALRQGKKKMEIPNDYGEQVERATFTFGHQRVFDKAAGCLVPLTPLPPLEELPFPADELADVIGADLLPEVARGVAEGVLHPKTYEPYVRTYTPRPAAAAAPRPARPVPPAFYRPAAPLPPSAEEELGEEGEEGAEGPAPRSARIPAPRAAPKLTLLLSHAIGGGCFLAARAEPAPRAEARPNPFAKARAAGGGSPQANGLFQTQAKGSAARRVGRESDKSLDEVTVQLSFGAAQPRAADGPSSGAQEPAPSPLRASPRRASLPPAALPSRASPRTAERPARDSPLTSPRSSPAVDPEPDGEGEWEGELRPALEQRSRPPARLGAACAHCNFENALRVHVCAACDRLLGPGSSRPNFATPRDRHPSHSKASQPAAATGKRPLEQPNRNSNPAHSSKARKLGAGGKAVAGKQSIMSFFAKVA
ncbi:PIN domain-like protein [Pavlovales sp. CCMP2436]|nr:PIN domain-like protein [Pavlovales sp. CCMP2436]